MQRLNGFSSNNPSISFSFYLSFRSIVFVNFVSQAELLFLRTSSAFLDKKESTRTKQTPKATKEKKRKPFIMSANANTEAVPDTAAALAIEHVTEALANTSIATNSADTAEADAAHAAHAASAAEGRRLYIGNLAYSTTDDQLKEFFTGFDM